ncbi:MAG: response regulator [Deltaproteobacteria bacterium]|nr:response regulator [Deltaproteobacteria bacterium]
MSGESILVIDDNPTNLKLLRVLLSGAGYHVRTSQDAEQALAEMATFRPRLILMDLQLPGMDGLELTRKLKAAPATKGVTIVAVTSYAMKGDAERAREAGCDDYVPKPIDTEALPRIVARHLREQESRGGNDV